MRRYCAVIGLALLVLAITSSADAQTHPCDQAVAPQPTIQSGAPHKLQFCAAQADTPEALLALVDGTPHDLVPITAKTAPSSTGLVLFESAIFLQVARGTHSLTVALYNRNQFTGQLQLGGASSPLAFAAADDTPKATAPVNIRIVR